MPLMYRNKILHMAVERGREGAIIVKDGKATATWLAPVAREFFVMPVAASFCERLAQEVLARAALDALGFTAPLRQTGKDDRGQLIVESQRWFLEQSEDYVFICNLAGADPERMKKAVTALFLERKIS